MLRSVNSSPDTHDGHLWSLLDQRTARADPLDRFSQYSDTPSIYSRGHFSPRTGERGDVQSLETSDFHYNHPQYNDARSTRERLEDPQTSTLDLSDESRRSSMTASDTYDDDPRSFEDIYNDDLGDRMSYLGPKMRFHSRAPWELETDGLQEEDEPVESPKHHGFPFSFGGNTKGGSSPSSSPRLSHSASRPSGDSMSSHVPPKRSFDTINSQLSSRGALYALAQESLSATSLGRVSGSAPKDSLRSKFSSLGRARTPTISTPSSPTAPSSPVHPSFDARIQTQSIALTVNYNPRMDSNYDADRTSFAPSSYSTSEIVHPYANPDLIVTYERDTPIPNSPTLSQHSPFPRVGSSATVTQSFLSAEASRPKLPDAHHTSSQPNLTAGSRTRMSTIQAKGISSPIAVQSSVLPASMSSNIVSAVSEHGALSNSLVGWTERVVPPSFSLISLEEARAQRARSPVASDDLTRTVTTTSTAQPPMSYDDSGTSPPSINPTTRSRGRTISAGTKAKNAIQTMVGAAKPDRRDSEPALFPPNATQPASKSLKHRKSGFMRLFNGGKDKEGEAPPPVPSMPSDQDSWKKPSVSRVPVPSFTSDLNESPSIQSTASRLFPSGSSGSRPSPPMLQINTQANRGTAYEMDRGPKSSLMAISPTSTTKPWLNSSQPQSAPPDISTFPALKLRPVSSLFSSGFEHIVPDLQTNANEYEDVDTPISSPNEPILPITPGVLDGFSMVESDSQSIIIKSLREQLVSSKLASQREIWELEGQIRDLKQEVEQLRSMQRNSLACENYNSTIYSPPNGRYSPSNVRANLNTGRSTVNRPRAKTGTNARFVNAHT